MLRKKINALDQKLLKTLKERFRVIQKIGKVKKGRVADLKRERELLQQWLAEGLDEKFTQALFRLVVKEAKKRMYDHHARP